MKSYAQKERDGKNGDLSNSITGKWSDSLHEYQRIVN